MKGHLLQISTAALAIEEVVQGFSVTDKPPQQERGLGDRLAAVRPAGNLDGRTGRRGAIPAVERPARLRLRTGIRVRAGRAVSEPDGR